MALRSIDGLERFFTFRQQGVIEIQNLKIVNGGHNTINTHKKNVSNSW